MKIRNLTPHPVTLQIGDRWVTLPPEGITPRCYQETEKVDDLPTDQGLVALTRNVYGKVANLPEPGDDLLIVSRMVAEACPLRTDLVIVNETVRDESGRIAGARSLATISGKRPFLRK